MRSSDVRIEKGGLLCGAIAFARPRQDCDVLLMDVGRPTEKSLDRRMEAILRSKKKNTTMKAGLLCDNASDPEIAQKVKQAKENGFIDVFFYESVQTDYLCDVVDSL